MRILFISRACSPNAGGMEYMSYKLIQAARQKNEISSHTIIYQGSRKLAPLFCLTVIPQALLTARHYDVIHLGDPLLSIIGWFIKVILRKKVAVSVHGLDVLFPSRFYQLYLRTFFRSFDYYFPISQAVSAKLDKLNTTGQVNVINPGVSADYYDPSITRESLLHLLQSSLTTPVIARPKAEAIPHNSQTDNQALAHSKFLFTSGRLVKRKGHAWFINNVLPHLPSHTHYLIAGTGPDQAAISQATNDQNLQNRVHLLGRVSKDKLRILYNTADAFIQPNISISHDMEGFGLVLLEAALCNQPIFASSLEGITDAVIDGQNGTLLPTADTKVWISTLTAFISAPTPSQPKSARAFTLDKYSWDSYLDQLLKTIK